MEKELVLARCLLPSPRLALPADVLPGLAPAVARPSRRPRQWSVVVDGSSVCRCHKYGKRGGPSLHAPSQLSSSSPRAQVDREWIVPSLLPEDPSFYFLLQSCCVSATLPSLPARPSFPCPPVTRVNAKPERRVPILVACGRGYSAGERLRHVRRRGRSAVGPSRSLLFREKDSDDRLPLACNRSWTKARRSRELQGGRAHAICAPRAKRGCGPAGRSPAPVQRSCMVIASFRPPALSRRSPISRPLDPSRWECVILLLAIFAHAASGLPEHSVQSHTLSRGESQWRLQCNGRSVCFSDNDSLLRG